MRHRGFHVPGRRYLGKGLRIAGAVAVVLVLATAMSAGGLYFLLRGESIRSDALNASIAASIQRLLGPDYVVALGSTAVAFDPDGLLSVAGTDVRILRAADRQPVSTLRRVVVGVRPLSLFGDEPQIDAVIIEDSTLDFRVLPVVAPPWPIRDIEPALVGLGSRFAELGDQFARERFRLFRFSNVRISGLTLGTGSARDIDVEELELRFRQKSELTLTGSFATDRSNVSLAASYRLAGDGDAAIAVEASGINLREWLGDPFTEADGPAGWDSLLAFEGSLSIGPDGTPSQPRLALSVGDGTLRLGRNATTPVSELELSLRIIPEKNQIELDPSLLVAGDFRARLIGGVRPVDARLGYDGPLEFELIADPAIGEPTVVGEESVAASVRLLGRLDPERRLIDITTINIVAGEERMDGSAVIGLAGETPSIDAVGASAGMSVAAVKQLWPFWLAPPARLWAHRNLVGGRLTAISVEAAIPGGIIGRFRQGAKIAPDGLKLRADFAGVRIDSFGELPPIREGAGRLAIDGMTFRAELTSGGIFLADNRSVRITAGSFEVADYGERPADAEVRIAGEGDARALAEVAASQPLDVPARINLAADHLSGEANVDVVARFPIKPGLKAADVDWNAIVETRKAASAAPFQGRRVAEADLVIEATPAGVRVNGKAEIDGLATTLELKEPVGTAGLPPERVFTAIVDDKARKKMGLTLDPVVTGTMKVRFEQKATGSDQHEVDLTAAALNLPWVGWTKGGGIPAKASFRLRADGQVTHLDDFYLEGPGFSAAGTIAFDKDGVVSADFANVSLNQGDLLAVRIKRTGASSYQISAEGARFDARALINKLIHEGGFGDVQGNANIVVTANIGTVSGFGEQAISDVSLSYGTLEGWFDNLSVRGNFTDGDYVSILASTANHNTTFEIDTTDAGAALRLVDVYQRMSGGRMIARLQRRAGGPFKGPVVITDFVVHDEPRLKRLVAEPVQERVERGEDLQEIRRELAKVDTNQVPFKEAQAEIDKGDGYLRLRDGILRSSRIGFTFDGLVYDAESRMDLAGTFMPGISLSRAIGFIPLVGTLLGNGRDTSLIGITFRLSGPAKNPAIQVNPMSVVAPGVFRKVFEFRN